MGEEMLSWSRQPETQIPREHDARHRPMPFLLPPTLASSRRR